MSDLTTNTNKRDKEQAKLITPPSATIPPKLTKIEIPTRSPIVRGMLTPTFEIDSPVSAFRNNFLNFFEVWKMKNNLLTPSALNPLQEQNAQLINNQQVLAESLSEVKQNVAATKVGMNVTQEEVLKIQN